LFTGRCDEALSHARRAIEGNRNFALPYCVLAIGCVRLQRRDEASQAIRQLIGAAPSFSIGTLRKIRFADAMGLQPDLDLLQAARLPE
jgi:hypothetical protein